jgi:hypothetical protein
VVELDNYGRTVRGHALARDPRAEHARVKKIRSTRGSQRPVARRSGWKLETLKDALLDWTGLPKKEIPLCRGSRK